MQSAGNTMLSHLVQQVRNPIDVNAIDDLIATGRYDPRGLCVLIAFCSFCCVSL